MCGSRFAGYEGWDFDTAVVSDLFFVLFLLFPFLHFVHRLLNAFYATMCQFPCSLFNVDDRLIARD